MSSTVEDSKDIEILLPELESVANEEPASADARTMIGDGMSAEAASKLIVYELSVPLLLKDKTFSEFSRDLLLAIMKAFRCEAGSILELNSEKNVFFFRACVGQISDQLPNFEVPVTSGIVGQVAQSRKPVMVNDLTENEFHLQTLTRSLGFEARNMIALPIFVRGRFYGVVELINRVGSQSESFTQSDLDVGQAATHVISQILELRFMLGQRAKIENLNKTEKAA